MLAQLRPSNTWYHITSMIHKIFTHYSNISLMYSKQISAGRPKTYWFFIQNIFEWVAFGDAIGLPGKKLKFTSKNSVVKVGANCVLCGVAMGTYRIKVDAIGFHGKDLISSHEMLGAYFIKEGIIGLPGKKTSFQALN